jgi:Ca2+-binding RTX toxin-like protein
MGLDADDDGDAEVGMKDIELIVLSLGDGDDQFDASPTTTTAIATHVVVCAGAGNDTLRGGMNLDRLEGDAGDDRFRASETADGADVFDGGAGNDTADYSARTAPLTLRLDDKANDGEASEFDDLRVEHVVGGAGDDTIDGSDGADILDGGPGNDTIDGLGGDDIVNGGDGDDTFIATEALDGADIVNGGEGIDLIDYSARAIGIDVSLCTASATMGCDASCACVADDGAASEGDNLINVEDVRGTATSDHMIGDDSANQLFGNGGNDVLVGMAGDDSLFGDIGDDQLDGGDGDDYLDGGDGNDTFSGGEGQGDICVVIAPESAPQCELF